MNHILHNADVFTQYLIPGLPQISWWPIIGILILSVLGIITQIVTLEEHNLKKWIGILGAIGFSATIIAFIFAFIPYQISRNIVDYSTAICQKHQGVNIESYAYAHSLWDLAEIFKPVAGYAYTCRDGNKIRQNGLPDTWEELHDADIQRVGETTTRYIP